MSKQWLSRPFRYRRARARFDRRRGLSYLLLAALPLVHSQSFEVASVKPSANAVGREGGNRSRIEHTPTSLAMWNVTLSDCVQWSYGVEFFRIAGAHLSLGSYDVLAKTEA